MAKTSDSKTKKIVNIWTRYNNPLRNISQPEIDRLLSNARYGDDVKLQLCYFEIEKSTPIFSICINKRIAGVTNKMWDIVPVDDSEQAKKQAKNVKRMFLECDTLNEDGLTEAIRHLCMASFRGRSAVKPFVVDDKLIFKKLNNWNFISYNGQNYWNPSSDMGYVLFNGCDDLSKCGLDIIPKDEICYVIDDKPLDWIGITIYLRQLIGEESWARLIEKEGIPQIIIRVPEGTPESDLEKWNFRAQSIYEGASGSLPNGSGVDVLTQARGQDPFTSYIHHQMEQFAILATGGTLATLGGTSGATGAGMGSDVAEKQTDQFNSLVNYDCKRISNSLNIAVKKCVQSIYGNDTKILCRFDFTEKNNVDPKEYLEMARMCKEMGLVVDVQKLKEVTKLSFLSDSEKDIWTPEKDDNEEENN